MVSRMITTERVGKARLGRCAHRFALVLLAVGAWMGMRGPTDVAAHDTPRTAVREMVRIQGHRVEPGEEASAAIVSLRVHDEVLRFRVEDRQIFVAVAASGRVSAPEPTELTLRGPRELLARVREAGPEQRVTLLGERRPGGRELFLAAVDVCPCAAATESGSS